MAVCLDYQSVYYHKKVLTSSTRLHLVAAFVLLVALSFKVWMKVETIELGYKVAQQREMTVQYDMEKRDLDLQLSILTKPDNLRNLAKDRLGLDTLSLKQLKRIHMSEEGVG